MPRTSKTSDGAASSSAAGGGEETTDGVKKRQKLTVQDKDQLRELKRRFSQDMYAMAVAYLKNTLESIKTEGKGDCWLLTIMAGFEVKDRDLVASLRDKQREDICTKRRRAIVEWAADSKKNGGFSLLCEMVGRTVNFKAKNSVKEAEQYVQTRLKPWRTALHYGTDQEMMHACTGWYLRRNILQIDRDDSRCTGPRS